MQVELKHIKGDVLEQEYSCQVADFPALANPEQSDMVSYRDPVRFRLRFHKSAQIIDVDGRLDVVLELKCARCLCAFEQSVSENFSLTFTPQVIDEMTSEERQLESDDLGLISYQDECLELLEPLQEQLLMVAPIRALCKEDCRGLCLQCGADLNQQACSCEGKPFNNKFGVLAQVKSEGTSSSVNKT